MRQLELIDGPLAGTCHELHGGLVPAQVGLPDGGRRHWYEVRDGQGWFMRSEERTQEDCKDANPSE